MNILEIKKPTKTQIINGKIYRTAFGGIGITTQQIENETKKYDGYLTQICSWVNKENNIGYMLYVKKM